jgi:hypothetical protein
MANALVVNTAQDPWRPLREGRGSSVHGSYIQSRLCVHVRTEAEQLHRLHVHNKAQ